MTAENGDGRGNGSTGAPGEPGEPDHASTALLSSSSRPGLEPGDGATRVGDALVRAEAAGTLVDLYDAWLRLRVARVAAAADRHREAERLDVRAEYMLGALETARQVSVSGADVPADAAGAGQDSSLQKTEGLAEFQRSAEAELREARRSLALRAESEDGAIRQAINGVRAALLAKTKTILAGYVPTLQVQVQPVGRERSLVHIERPGSDDAILIAFLLTHRLPTRYDSFFDDTVDDLSLGPARFYADDGNERVRFDTLDEEDEAAVAAGRDFVPAKGCIFFRVPGHDFPRFRMVNHGPLAEVEARLESGAYESLMPREAAELLAGYLIRLKVEGRLGVTLKVG